MISKYSVAMSAVPMLMNLSINSVQSLTMDNTITYDKDLHCSDCIRSGNIFAYEPDFPFSALSIGNRGKLEDHCYSSTSGDPGQPSDPISDFDLNSDDFYSADYAVAMCPQASADCGSDKFFFFDPYHEDYEEVEVDQVWENAMSSCGYVIRADCGTPYVTVTDLTGVTASDLELTVTEFSMNIDLLESLEGRYIPANSIDWDWPNNKMFADSVLPYDFNLNPFSISDLTVYDGTTEELIG